MDPDKAVMHCICGRGMDLTKGTTTRQYGYGVRCVCGRIWRPMEKPIVVKIESRIDSEDRSGGMR